MVKFDWFTDTNGDQIGFDGYLAGNLDIIKGMLNQDLDFPMVIAGPEGSGKSVLGMQIAKYVYPELSLDDVTFTPKEFIARIKSSKPCQAIIFDEALTGLTARQAMSRTNRAILRVLGQVRQKRLFLIIIIPNFFDLDKMVSLWRSRALLNVYFGDGYARGYFSFFNEEKKKNLWVYGHEHYNEFATHPNFRGRFTNAYVLDEAAYRKKKYDLLLKADEEADETEKRPNRNEVKMSRRADILMYLMHEKLGVKLGKLSGMMKEVSPESFLEVSSISERITNLKNQLGLL